MLLIGKSATGENAWIPTDDEPMLRGHEDGNVDYESTTKFMESFSTTTVSDPTDT